MVFHRHSPARAVSDRVRTGSLSRISARRNAFRATLTLADPQDSPPRASQAVTHGCFGALMVRFDRKSESVIGVELRF